MGSSNVVLSSRAKLLHGGRHLSPAKRPGHYFLYDHHCISQRRMTAPPFALPNASRLSVCVPWGAAAQRKHALSAPRRHVLANRTLKALLLPTAQAHCVREQAAAIGPFRQPMLFVSEAAIRDAGVHLAAASTLSTAPSRRSAGPPPAAAAAGVEVEVPTAAAAAAAAAAAGNSSSGSEYCVVFTALAEVRRRWLEGSWGA